MVRPTVVTVARGMERHSDARCRGASKGDERGWDFSFRPGHPRTPGTAAHHGFDTPPNVEPATPFLRAVSGRFMGMKQRHNRNPTRCDLRFHRGFRKHVWCCLRCHQRNATLRLIWHYVLGNVKRNTRTKPTGVSSVFTSNGYL